MAKSQRKTFLNLLYMEKTKKSITIESETIRKKYLIEDFVQYKFIENLIVHKTHWWLTHVTDPPSTGKIRFDVARHKHTTIIILIIWITVDLFNKSSLSLETLKFYSR